MQSTTFTRLLYLCTVTEAPADGIAVARVGILTELIFDVEVDPAVMIGADAVMLPDTEIVALDSPATTSECTVEIAYAAEDVLIDVSAIPKADVAPGTTPLEVTLSSL